MTRSFRRNGDRIRWQLQAVEVNLLHAARDGLRAVLQGGDPADPVVARLFPASISNDPEADEELRAMLYPDLLATRLAGLDDLHALLERGSRHRGGLRVDLEADEAILVLGVLNDLRLAIGARAGVGRRDQQDPGHEDPARADLDGEDPARVAHETDEQRTQRLAVMDHFAWLQEQLLAIIDPPSVQIHREASS